MTVQSRSGRFLLLALALLIYTGSQGQGKPNTMKNEQSYAARSANDISNQQMQNQLGKELHNAVPSAPDSMMMEAATVVAETRRAIRFLLDSNTTAATRAIETAIGKAAVVTAANPNMAMIPIDVSVSINDLVADMETLMKIRKSAQDFTNQGYLQDARRLLEDLISELSISASNLPLATYPIALTEASKLVNENRLTEAALVLTTAINTIVTEITSVPLPLIRTEATLTEVATLLASGNANVDTVSQLLDYADYQIHFAEALGYGKKDKEYRELYDAIKTLKSAVKRNDKSAEKSNTDLRNKLNKFKNRISMKTK
jgi:hypothetical protein